MGFLGMLIVYGMAIPLFILALWAAALRPKVHKVHVTFLGLLIRYDLPGQLSRLELC